MDLMSQAILGACAAQAVAGHRLPRSAWLMGAAAGLLPDADVLIRPASDPLGGLLWHRHATHALLVAPLLAVPVALAACIAPSVRTVAGWAFAAACAALLTHAPLDAATSYGTLLYWPFSGARVAWDLLPIIDPLVTIPMTILLMASVWKTWRSRRRDDQALPTAMSRARMLAALGVLWVMAYAGFGATQWGAAERVQQQLAQSRGHTIEAGRMRLMPQPLSLLLWRSIYEYCDPVRGEVMIQSDFIRLPHWPYSLLGAHHQNVAVLPGRPHKKLNRAALLSERDVDLSADDRIGDTFDRFAWFADNYVAIIDDRTPGSDRPLMVGDMRYAIGPESVPLWGVIVPTLGATGDELRMGSRFGDPGARASELWQLLTGQDLRLQAPP